MLEVFMIVALTTNQPVDRWLFGQWVPPAWCEEQRAAFQALDPAYRVDCLSHDLLEAERAATAQEISREQRRAQRRAQAIAERTR